MSQKLISHNQDLKKLQKEGYDIQIQEAHLIIRKIPYVNSDNQINLGDLISTLELAGEKTSKPSDHTVFFTGCYPCDKEGNCIEGIRLEDSPEPQKIAGKQVRHKFSNKPPAGYEDYFEKMDTYIKIISHPAQSIDSSVTAKTYPVIPAHNDNCVFQYLDSNSSRANINELSKKLISQKIAIIGLGGTGSYVLDLVSKTPVSEIHLFDQDTFSSHNAFRTPGAIPLNQLNNRPKKTDYLKDIYSNIHKNIYSHSCNIETSNFKEISDMSFVFICIDNSPVKKSLFDFLIENKIPFIDTGIGIKKESNGLSGIVRVNLCSSTKKDHLKNHISFSDNDRDNAYSTNIQIADINALNASLAIIKWKKTLDFYSDMEKEYTNFYTINTQSLVNQDHESKI